MVTFIARYVLAKARVAPSKVTSIPRLELSAAVVASRLSAMLHSELDLVVDQEFFWTDSQIVLSYISNEARRFHTFVANRVQLIRQNSRPDQWHHVASTENPADMASRGLRADEIKESTWLSGPSFLWRTFETEKTHPTSLRVDDPEVRSTLQTSIDVLPCDGPSVLIDQLTQISSWTRLVQVVIRIKRLAHRAAKSSVEEKEDAVTAIVRIVQSEAFPHEITQLRHDQPLTAASPLSPLRPFLDVNGQLRVGGRLKHSALPEKVKHPVILPKKSPVSQLVARHFHEKCHHQGYEQTINEMRSNGFWIVGASRMIASTIKGCATCRKLRRPPESQLMSNLPEDRTASEGPFVYVGMDCFGPFVIKRGRSDIKRYGLIFTCLSTRAVHIEALDDMTTDAFINSLRCFIAIRGPAKEIRCDQGSNFIGASSEFEQAVKPDLEKFLYTKECKFNFSAPASSHANGVWERQIRTVRAVLSATLGLGPNRLDDSLLRTFFYEAMYVVNSRPLSPSSLGDPLSEPPLTPNHFLTMKTFIARPPPGIFVREDLVARKRWKRVQFLLEQFWSKWKKEYITGLQVRQKWLKPRRNVSVGDIVLLMDDNLPRNQWRLGRVTQTQPGTDGLVRRTQVLVNTPLQGLTTLERPVQKLVVIIEASDSSLKEDNHVSS